MENISAKYPLGISKISNIKVNVSDLQNGGWYEDVNYANHWCAEPFVWIDGRLLFHLYDENALAQLAWITVNNAMGCIPRAVFDKYWYARVSWLFGHKTG